MENLPKFKFKRDAYMKKRGNPAMLLVTCAKCGNYVMHYQKDGPGPLLRCYLDRIHYPEMLRDRQDEAFDTKTSCKLACGKCNVVLGVPMMYEKENRPAYHMRPGFFHRKKQKDIAF
jgi:hypothetical protein